MTSTTTQHDVQAQKLFDTVERYTAAFPSRPAQTHSSRPQGDVILVTGTTGGLGCNILAQLSLDPSVKKIYALNRASAREGLVDRQVKALQDRGVSEDCLRCPKFQLVEADLSKPLLGLHADLYAEIRDSVCHIIHNAWSVKLVRPLEYFEDCFQGLRNLIDLALTSPFVDIPKFLFVSSMSMLRNYPGPNAPEELVPDPAVSIGFGYTESKWVAERMLVAAEEATGLPATSVRVGIVCGDRNGHWGTSDIYPLIVKSALTLRCLPDAKPDALVSWVPSWEGAGVLCAMRHSNEPVLHLANPNPVPWRSFFEVFAEEVGVPLVTFGTWISLLQNYSNDTSIPKPDRAKRNPAIHLLPYFAAADMSPHKEFMGHTRLDTSKAVEIAPMLKDIRIGRENAVDWVRGWRKRGFLPPKARPPPMTQMSGFGEQVTARL